MTVEKNERGFEQLMHPKYAANPPEDTRLVFMSSIIGNYDDALDRPGTSALWIGADHHLNREGVVALIVHLQRWLDTGAL